MPAPTYTKAGIKAQTSVKLNEAVFGIKQINQDLLHQAYLSYLANGRVNLAVTKTRGLVRGGGRKPWRQKGTGRARVGSNRTPVWRGGGIVFGPTGLENYSKKLSTQAKRNAICHALSAANSAAVIKVIEELSLKEPKTSALNKLMNKVDTNGYTLLVTDSIDDNLRLAARNLAELKVIQARYLNVARILDADTIIITKAALAEINDWLTPKKDSK